jgi:hypothetical protein
METCRKIASPRPPVEGRQPLRLAIEARSFQPGAYSAFSAFSAHFIGVLPPVYPPVGLAPGLSPLSSLCSHISTGAGSKRGASG